MTSQSPKVLHVVYDLMRGGTEGQCAHMAVACRKAGCDHDVAVFSRSGYFLQMVEDVCGPVYEMAVRRMLSFQTLREIWRLRCHLRSGNYDLVHAWDMDAGIFGALAARLAGVPYVTSRRNLAERMPGYKRWLLRMADRGAAAVVVNAEAVGSRFISGGLAPEKVHHVHNMIDLQEFDRLASQDARLPAGRIVGMVCRLEPEKDAGTLIKAVPHLLQEFTDLNVVIVGDGTDRQRLVHLARALHVEHAVHFMGERMDVPALARKFHVGVLAPSRNEGLSNAILEYMAAGIPVVATDCGGNAEVLGNGSAGIIVPVGDAMALAEAISFLLKDDRRAKEIGDRGRQRVTQYFSPERAVEEMNKVYESAATCGRRK
ncbi:MAG: glycosyltransferase [Kiritimatiellia bacterium]